MAAKPGTPLSPNPARARWLWAMRVAIKSSAWNYLLFVNPNQYIVAPGLKTKLTISAHAPISQTRVNEDHGVSLTPKMLHVRTGQNGFHS
jgi:hypothetical protein